MKNSSKFALLTVLTMACQAVSAATIIGKVTLNGQPPAEQPYETLMADAICGKTHTSMPTTEHFIVGPNKELANVIVSLKGMDGQSTGAAAAPAELDQKGCLYVPSILAVQTGQKIMVKNSDPVVHNVHSMPTVAGNQEQNLPQMGGGPALSFVIPKAENFLKFKCDVHQWMFAWVTAFDHPFFSVTGKDGTFKITNVKPGKYTIVAMHRKAAPKGVEKEIEVKDGDTTVDFTLDLK